MVDRQPPRHPHEPGAKTVAIPKLPEIAIRLDERVLCHVFGVLPMPQHGVQRPGRPASRTRPAGLRIRFRVPGPAHEAAGMPSATPSIPFSGKTPPARPGFSRLLLQGYADSMDARDPPGTVPIGVRDVSTRCTASGRAWNARPRFRRRLLSTLRGAGLTQPHSQRRPAFERGAVIRTLLRRRAARVDYRADAVSRASVDSLSADQGARGTAQGRPVPASFTDDVDLMIEETKAAARGRRRAASSTAATPTWIAISRR